MCAQNIDFKRYSDLYTYTVLVPAVTFALNVSQLNPIRFFNRSSNSEISASYSVQLTSKCSLRRKTCCFVRVRSVLSLRSAVLRNSKNNAICRFEFETDWGREQERLTLWSARSAAEPSICSSPVITCSPVICRFRLRGARDGDALLRGYESALNQMPSNSAHVHKSTIIRKQTQRERDYYRSTNDALRNTVFDIEPPSSSLCTVKWHYVEMPRLLKWWVTWKANSASSLG